MANDIQFYNTNNLNEIPIGLQNGAIYFVLNDNEEVASLFVDLNNSRYEVKTIIPEATDTTAGLMTATDKRKLIPISIEKYDNRTDINTEKSFNFLKNITINNDEVLTKSSIAGVNVFTNDNPDATPRAGNIQLIKTTDNSYYLDLYLDLPAGPRGEQGLQGISGKSSRISNAVASYSEDDTSIPDVLVSSSSTETDEYIDTDLNFNFKNLKGPRGDKGDQGIQGPKGDQGIMANIQFRFRTGNESDQIGCEQEIIREDNQDITLVTVTVPRGPKGDKGDNFTISKIFNSYAEMEANIDTIPRETFVLISSTADDPATGELYYRKLTGELQHITDLVPIQPRFSVVEEVTTLPWNENGTVTLSYLNEDLSTPQLSFKIPRGKPLDFGTHYGNIEYNNEDTPPSISIDSEEIEDTEEDIRKQDLTFNFTNLGKIYETTADIDNTVGTPQVTVTPSVENNKQKLHFNFEHLKGVKGDIGPAPIVKQDVNLNILAGDPLQNPAGTAYWTDEEGKKVLNLSLTNIKGQDGNVAEFSTQGAGNAVSEITYVGRNMTIKKDYIFTTEDFAKNADNIENGTIKVKNGGTGLNTVPLNNLLLGDGINNLKTIENAAGALISDGSESPHFGILPVTLGGTGATNLTNNAVLVGNGTNGIKQISTSSGALFATGSGYTIQFGTLPVSLGGSGDGFFPLNSVLLGNRDDAFKSVNSLKGALYSSADAEKPQFGTLPVNVGGTGATTAAQARVNLGATYTKLVAHTSKANDYILKIENTVTPV